MQRFPRPEEFARVPVERVDNTRLAGNARYHAPELPGRDSGTDPRHLVGVRRHRHVNQVAFENVVQVPVVARQVLVVPDQVAGRRIGRQGAVGVQHIAPPGTAQLLQRRRRRRGAPVQEPEHRVVARHVAPGADMPAPLVGQVAPTVVSRFAGPRDGPSMPPLAAGFRVASSAWITSPGCCTYMMPASTRGVVYWPPSKPHNTPGNRLPETRSTS